MLTNNLHNNKQLKIKQKFNCKQNNKIQTFVNLVILSKLKKLILNNKIQIFVNLVTLSNLKKLLQQLISHLILICPDTCLILII